MFCEKLTEEQIRKVMNVISDDGALTILKIRTYDKSFEDAVAVSAVPEVTAKFQEDGKTYSFGTAHVTVTGDSSSLNGLRAEDLNGSVHVNGMSEGTHRVLVHLDLPNGLNASPVYIDVTVSGDGSASANE